MDVVIVGVAVVTDAAHTPLGLDACLVEVGDVKFAGDNCRGRRAEVAMEMTEAVGRPPIGEIEMPIVADVQNRAPVLDRIVEPR